MTKFVKDDEGHPVPLLGYKSLGGQAISFNSSTATLSTQFHITTDIITITATSPVFIALGNSSVVANKANSHYILDSVPYDIVLGSNFVGPQDSLYLSVIGSTSSGTLYISERI